MSEQPKKSIKLSVLRRIYSLAKPFKWLFAATVIATLISAALSPLRAWITQIIIDEYILNKDLKGLLDMTLLMIVLLLFQTIIQFAQAYSAGFIGQNVIQVLRVNIFKHIHSYKSKKLDQSAVGTLVTRNISDLETIAEVFNEGLISIIGDLLQIIFIVILMVSTSWQLTLISLSVLPLLLYSGYIFKNAVKSSFIETRNQVTKLNTFVQEHIQGMQIVQIFNRGQQEFKKFDAINQSHQTF